MSRWSIPNRSSGGRIQVTNMVEVARVRAATAPGRTVFVLHIPNQNGEEILPLSYGQVDRRARCVAAALREDGAARFGSRVLLLYPPPSAEYIAAFFGCLYAGVLPVPVYPPVSTSQWKLLATIIRDCQPAAVCTTAAAAQYTAASLTAAGVPRLRLVATDEADEPLDEASIAHPDAEAIALLQYTSGSTGQPKGVMVRHRNLLANLEVIASVCGSWSAPDSVGTIWLPPYHDMGLIGGILDPVYQDFPMHLTSPLSFLRDPLSWLRLISEIRATTTGGPDFAYALCASKARPHDLAGLDLTSWQTAINGAEPMRPQTIAAFTATFGPAGFRRTAFTPGYGLAEATLVVASTGRQDEPLVIPERRAVASGEPRDCAVLIVAPDGRPVSADGEEGEIWLSGPSVTAGYWGREEETQQAFGARLPDGTGPYLRTGDLGYRVGEQIVVLSRIKDLIIVRGRNIAPAIAEVAAWDAVPLLKPGCAAAFAVEGADGEEVAIVAEARDPSTPLEQLAEATQQMRAAVAAACGVGLRLAVIVPPGTVPKTSSGKIRRSLCRDLLLRGSFTELCHTNFAPAAEDTTARDKQSLPERRPPQSESAGKMIADIVALILGVPADTLGPDRPWAELGLASTDVARMAAVLQDRIGMDIPAALLFDHPTISRLAAEFDRRTAGSTNSAPARQRTRLPAESGEAIAIVGMACRFPGADDTDAFWELLRNGGDTVSKLSGERRNLSGCDYDGRPLGALADIDCFDAPLFGVSAPEARAMDPQHRLLLEMTWAALEESGFDPKSLSASPTGVYVGISSADYAQIALHGRPSRFTGIGASPAAAAGRISYQLGLHGPSLAIDTACSSSLAAVHIAIQALRRRECELAIAGGVNLVLTPEPTAALERLGVLSPSNQCRPFDAAADGYVRGEGCGVVILVPLSEARRQRLPIRAVIRGSALNHNGHGNGITAPSGAAQREVIGEALRNAGLEPTRIGYLEAHGSGTAIGDAIELAAAGEALGGARRGNNVLQIGSAKAYIGHLEAAAGIAGLIKAVLTLEQEEFPALPLPSGPTPKIDWTRARLAVAGEAASWPSGQIPSSAGVSSFGFSGTNVHVVLEQAPAPLSAQTRVERPGQRVIAVVSARNGQALGAAVDRLARALRRTSPDLAAVAGTLAEHRTRFGYRAAFHAATLSELLSKLDKWLTDPLTAIARTTSCQPELTVTACTENCSHSDGFSLASVGAILQDWHMQVCIEQHASGDEDESAKHARIHFETAGATEQILVDLVNVESVFEAACIYFVLGGDLNLRAVNGPGAHRVRLPAYPFEKRRYWIDGG